MCLTLCVNTRWRDPLWRSEPARRRPLAVAHLARRRPASCHAPACHGASGVIFNPYLARPNECRSCHGQHAIQGDSRHDDPTSSRSPSRRDGGAHMRVVPLSRAEAQHLNDIIDGIQGGQPSPDDPKIPHTTIANACSSSARAHRSRGTRIARIRVRFRPGGNHKTCKLPLRHAQPESREARPQPCALV